MKAINYKLFLAFPAGLIGFALLLLSASGALAQTTTNTWTGQTGSDWHNAANWSLTAVPGTGDDVVIPAGTTSSPILSTTTVAKSVEVQSGASLTISSSGSLSITGAKPIPIISAQYHISFFNSGTVVNQGALSAGNTALAGLWNVSYFSNLTGGSITIDGTSSRALANTDGTFVNAGTIRIGSIADPGPWGIENQASFSNVTSGTITIDRTSSMGIYNLSGTFNNAGSIRIGSLNAVNSSGLWNKELFTNEAGGNIDINMKDKNGTGLLNESPASFVNSATITLGSLTNAGGIGLSNQSSFSNLVGGSITIDQSGGYALSNNNSGSFLNAASIRIGTIPGADAGYDGLSNRASFSNVAGGSIAINRTGSTGLSNGQGSFINSATITIGTVAGVGFSGLSNSSSFSNLTGGHISIDRTNTIALSTNNNFVNQATITIGASATGNAIAAGGVFTNQGCQALINSLGDAVISGSSSFSNTGTLIERSSGNSSISYNGGLVQDLNGGTFTIGSGTTAVTGTGLYWRGCVSSNWNTAANWSAGTVPTATDDVTIPAGTAYSPILSTTAVAKSVEVQPGASLTISAAGSLSINSSKSYSGATRGFSNSGQVRNEGQLILGNTGAVGTYGLYNAASFTNTATGSIQIDNFGNTALYNNTGSSFVNSATIVIGAVHSLGQYGLSNSASFTNTAAGNIQIDQTTIGLATGSGGSFYNAAAIVIGANSDIRAYGLYNGASFTNTVAGSIQIDRTATTGLYNAGGTFINQATVTIGSSATGTAITNAGSINNQGCQALINSLGDAVISGSSSFSNTGTLIERSSGNSSISYNGGLVQDLNGGTFTITNNQGLFTTATGQFWRGCVSSDWNTATNWSAGTVPAATDDVTIPAGTAYSPVLSTTAVAKSVEVQTGASLSISSNGSLSITGNKSLNGSTRGFSNSGQVRNEGRLVLDNTGSVSSYALFNETGSFVNSATITIGSLIDPVGYGLYNVSSFTNTAAGRIQIDGAAFYGLYNEPNSYFVNSAAIVIGSVGNMRAGGLYNVGSFTNTAAGSIQIDRTSTIGLLNDANSRFVNSATIVIGSLGSVGEGGLYNYASFTNTGAGSIQIDRISDIGLFSSGSFVNSATITIGTVAGVGEIGLLSASSFSNLTGGNITIDRTTTVGLNTSNNFVNQATITIGANATGVAIATGSGTVFNNQGCQALINSLGDATITDFSSLSNTGTIIEHSSGNSSISFNGGLVQNLNGGTFDITTGQPPLSVSATDLTTCNPANGSLTIAGVQPATAYTLSYTVGNTTASLTQTGNGAGQLVAANLSGGTYALALSGSCVAQTLPLSATLGAPAAFTLTTQPPATSVVCAGASASATVGVSGTTAPVTYQWYKNSLASPVVSQTAATLLLTNLTTAESGSYFVVITDNCSSATSAAFTLTVNTISGFTVSSATVCPGQTINLTASGCSGQVLWPNGATGSVITLTAGSSTSLLTATCTAGVCSATATGQVVVGGIQPPPAQILSFTADEAACPVRLTGRGVATSFTMTGTGGYVFSTVFREGATHEAVGLNVKQAGTYTLTATYTNSCGTSTPVTRTVTVGRNCP